MNEISVPIIEKKEVFEKLALGALIVDVRTPQEQESGIIDGALCIDTNEVFERLSEFGSDKEREIILYCKSGGRSGAVGEFLKSIGFKNVFNAGGYESLS